MGERFGRPSLLSLPPPPTLQVAQFARRLKEQGCLLISIRGIKGAVSRQSSSFRLILPITRPQWLWNLK